MGGKVNIFADISSFINLLTNHEFENGKDLKYLIRQRADVYLMIEKEALNERWNNEEDILRKLCDAYDIPCPHALPQLNTIFNNPAICYQLDAYGIWMINASESDIYRFRNYFGVWMVNPSSIKDDTFYLHHKREYEKDDIIIGSSSNGWANYIEELTAQGKQLPPLNAIVINDRYLLLNTNEHNAERHGFMGLNNIKRLLDALLPRDLRIPFQVVIYCQHPQLDIIKTDTIITKFKCDVQALRAYSINIEFFFDASNHKRTLNSNYFLFDADRGYNAFHYRDYNRFAGENFFNIESYHNDPYCTGDTNYVIAREKIAKIKVQCHDVYDNPNTTGSDYSLIKRCNLPDPGNIQNRLFS